MIPEPAGEPRDRNARSRPRAVTPAVYLTALIALPGCARVDPRADFAGAAREASARTGVSDVYDPDADALVEQKVRALLADGLTVDEAVRVALLNNRGFQAIFQTIGASRAEVVQSGLLSNPSLSLNVRFPEGGGRSDLMVNFGQELVELWQIPVRKRVAQAKLDETVQMVLERAVELAAAAKTQCFNVIALQQQLETVNKQVELIERSLHLAQQRFTAGETGLLDVNLVRANLLEVQIMQINTQRDLKNAEASLARVLGLSRWDAAWKLTDSLDGLRAAASMPASRPATPEPPAGDADMITLAMRQRFDARAAEARVRTAEAEYRRQVLNVFPSIMAGAEVERVERRALPGRKILADTARSSIQSGALTAPTIQSRAERDRERRQIIDALLGPTLQITLPIWDQNQAQIAKANFEAQQRRKEYEDLLDEVAGQVRIASATARTADQLVQFYREQSLPLAQRNIDAAQRAYEAGEQSIVALIEAQDSLITQQRAFINAARDRALARTELERVLGGRVPG